MTYKIELNYKKYNNTIESKNILQLLQNFIDKIENLYENEIEIKNAIDKNYLIDLSYTKNKGNIPFGIIDHSIINLDKNIINNLKIIKDYLSNNAFIKNKDYGKNIKISTNQKFYAFGGSTEKTIKNIIFIIEDLEKKIIGLTIKTNIIENKTIIEETIINKRIYKMNKNEECFFNKIIFGPTGTGKSKLANEYAKNIAEDKNILTVSFHPEYSYFDFMGQYKPVVYEKNSSTENVLSPYNYKSTNMTLNQSYVSYSFTYGIFFEAIIKSLSNDKNVVLLIEEINRGDCATIFGDVLQLLDRDENGNSKYHLNLSLDMKRYLISLFNIINLNNNKNVNIMQGVSNEDLKNSIEKLLESEKIYIPHNLKIIATMNTSDQSLYPMDSAFKRRWEMEYLAINYENKNIKIENNKTNWVELLRVVNKRIIEELNTEDKTIGQWFIIHKNNLITEKEIKNKLLSYLYFDVFKHQENIFGDKMYSDILNLSIDELIKLLNKEL